MAEQFVFDQMVRQGAAIDRDERLVGALALVVDGAGSQFLAAAGFAADEYGGVIAGNLVDCRQHVLKNPGFPN